MCLDFTELVTCIQPDGLRLVLVSYNPMLYENFRVLSLIRPTLLLIKVLHCVNREFRIFLRKMVENIQFLRAACNADAV